MEPKPPHLQTPDLMAKAFTIKNMPDDLHERLKERAEIRRRSMNSEVLDILEQVLGPRPVDALERRRRLHREVSAEGSEEMIQQGKRQGRI